MDIKTKIDTLPNNSGCYIYKDKYGKVIYVGKAKDLKKRVKSYFNRSHNTRIQSLVNEIADLEYIITTSEVDSLVLEYNLIKKYDPKYNILMTDDKSYPYILLTNEQYPKLLITRNKKEVKGKLYGPYPNSGAATQVVDLLNRNYPLVKCRKIPKEECLYYHINQCIAPCIRDVDMNEYYGYVSDVKRFLSGDTTFLYKKLQQEMQEASESLNYERAKELRDMLLAINLIKDKQTINVLSNLNVDVVNYAHQDNKISIQLIYIRNGALIERNSEIFDYVDNHEDVFIQYLLNMYHEKVLPDELIIPKLAQVDTLKDIILTKINTYVKGNKANYLKLCYENACEALHKYFASELNQINKKRFIDEGLKAIVGKSCYQIDMFDISHHGGVNTVGASITTKDFEFMKKLYRKYKVSVDQNDDVASMKEVVYRKYYRSLMEDHDLPDLIIADGGKTQVNAIKEVLVQLNLAIDVLGLIKDDKHRTSKVLYNNKVYSLDKYSELFKFFTRLQDEVHNFAIGYHQTIASRNIGASQLDDIKGIGIKRKAALIKHFKTIENIKQASIEELAAVVPKSSAKVIYDYFKLK